MWRIWDPKIWKKRKGPHLHTLISKKLPVLLRTDFVLTEDLILGLAKGNFVARETGKGLAIKQPGALSKDEIRAL